MIASSQKGINDPTEALRIPHRCVSCLGTVRLAQLHVVHGLGTVSLAKPHIAKQSKTIQGSALAVVVGIGCGISGQRTLVVVRLGSNKGGQTLESLAFTRRSNSRISTEAAVDVDIADDGVLSEPNSTDLTSPVSSNRGHDLLPLFSISKMPDTA